MESELNYKTDEKFNEESIIFCYELLTFLIDRRGLCDFASEIWVQPIENSEFTEEVGKAVLVTWHKFVKSYRQKLSKDFSNNYLPAANNIENYFNRHVAETWNDCCVCYRFLRMTAYFLELGFFCHDLGIDRTFDGTFHDFNLTPGHSLFKIWLRMVRPLIYKKIKDKKYGWKSLRRICVEVSKEYDKAGAEVDLGRCWSKFSLAYFFKKYEELTDTCLSFVSRFHIIDKKTGTKILPPGVLSRRIDDISCILASYQENDMPVKADMFARYMYVKIRKMTSLPEIIDVFRRVHLEAKRNRTMTPRPVEAAGTRRAEALEKTFNVYKSFLEEVQDGPYGISKRHVSKLEENYIKFRKRIDSKNMPENPKNETE